MSPELELIEQHEEALLVRQYLNDALSVPIAYLHCTIGPNQYDQKTNPFEIEFYWDEPEFGSIAKMDFREDMLEKFSDDPAHFKEQIKVAAKAFRDFADELDALAKQK